MSRIAVTRQINASPEKVFETVADIRNFSQAIPHITNVEFLTEQQYGLGTRFRETRLMKGKEASTELEVTEFVENSLIRLVADSHGCVWDTVFTVEPQNEGVELQMVMDARPYKLMARIMTPLIKGMIANAVESDMDAVKEYCEAKA